MTKKLKWTVGEPVNTLTLPKCERIMSIPKNTVVTTNDKNKDYTDMLVTCEGTTLSLNEVDGKLKLQLKDGDKEVFSMNIPIPDGLFKTFCKDIKAKWFNARNGQLDD